MNSSRTSPRIRLAWLLFLLPFVTSALGCQAVNRVLSPGEATLEATEITLPTRTPQPPLPTWTKAPTLTPTTALDTPAPTAPPTPRPTPSPTQLQVFDDLWSVINEEYLYSDFNGLDWDEIYREYHAQIQAGISDEEFYLLMDEMIYRLGDDHSLFLSPQDAAEDDAEYAGEYNYVGIGVLTSVVAERQRLVIILVFPGSPAEEAGLEWHDSILAVDGEPLVTTDGFRQNLLRGPEGTTITVTVQSPGGEPREVQITRRKITGALPVPYRVLTTPQGKRIGYIFIPTFNDSTVGSQIHTALREMTKDARLDGVILDNRENGGGASTVLTSALAPFTSGVVGHFINRDGSEPLRILGTNIEGSRHVPLVVLVGQGTASFGEVFAGVLRDQGRATIIGTQTGGNVEILWIYEFADGSRAWIAHDTFRPVNNPHEDWEETGIIPDIEVESSWDEVTVDSDPAVQAALRHFDGP
jgi:carboxyl-terminal processing protease